LSEAVAGGCDFFFRACLFRAVGLFLQAGCFALAVTIFVAGRFFPGW
jgi:hypothetical protein